MRSIIYPNELISGYISKELPVWILYISYLPPEFGSLLLIKLSRYAIDYNLQALMLDWKIAYKLGHIFCKSNIV